MSNAIIPNAEIRDPPAKDLCHDHLPQQPRQTIRRILIEQAMEGGQCPMVLNGPDGNH